MEITYLTPLNDEIGVFTHATIVEMYSLNVVSDFKLDYVILKVRRTLVKCYSFLIPFKIEFILKK